MNCNRTDKWLIEPQLENGTLGPNMDTESALRKRRVPVVNQARKVDYYNSSFHKGHLTPVSHAHSQSCSDATFTLTNAAPQNPSFNSGIWRVTESDMADSLKKNCINVGLRAFVVTGVVPGNNTMKNSRVQIPSHFWTAFCCLDQNDKPKLSGGYIGKNVNNTNVDNLTRQNLENKLKTLYNTTVTLFGSGC
ncbi:hypothetical protein AMELA_G00228350 [Ameiurus melas]|uniref:Endonuclease domain-containing 1 protein-like n=1 Tax=Ameiurus melas TaxID=219545 RepID=A0A7J5ZW75_AMEME|nr:hypothetical protein AMELA_G00228350 [Ameiurus melas]